MKILSSSSRNGGRRRRRYTPDQIRYFLDQFAGGDLSAAAFARRHGLCYTTFCNWRQQRGRQTRPLSTPRLEPVAIGSLLGPGWAAEIAWPGGPTLRLRDGLATAWTRELIEALRRPC